LPSPQIFGGTGNAGVVLPVTEETLNEILDKTKGMRTECHCEERSDVAISLLRFEIASLRSQ